MTTKMRSFRDFRIPIGCLILLAAFAAAGCSTAESPGGSGANMNHVLPSGSSVSGWRVVPSGGTHASSATLDYIANGGSGGCTQCHGSDLSGGISRVSCFANPAGCHHDPVSGWVAAPPAAQQHGLSAKRAPGNSSFFACQLCHGADFQGGGATVSCFLCHGVSAPHPPRPWRSGSGYTHTDTDPSNGPVCGQCHRNGANTSPSHPPPTPAPAGTPAGCFNNTLCHGLEVAPHALGSGWTLPGANFHGFQAKKDLAYCQSCHGAPGTTSFAGGVANTKCTTCHAVAHAHPTTWYNAPVTAFPGYVPSHRDSLKQDTTCVICHDYTRGRTPPDPAAPSCFSASYSNAEHASVTCHAAGPGAPDHLVPFYGHDNTTQAVFTSRCSGCHGISAPVAGHAAAPTCATCHTATAPTYAQGACTSCHGGVGTGGRPTGPAGSYPNVAGAHSRHMNLASAGTPMTCDTCHRNLVGGTLAGKNNHYDKANNTPRVGGRVPPGDVVYVAGTYDAKTGAPSFASGSFTCGNVRCHGGGAATPTPNWQTGTINTNTNAGCAACHEAGAAFQTPQYNSNYSGNIADPGRHHVAAASCTQCHNTGLLGANHFTSLSTTAFSGPGSTLGGISGGLISYNNTTKTCSNTAAGCHDGAAPQPWPF